MTDPSSPRGPLTDGPRDDRAGGVVALYLTFPNETVAVEIAETLVARRLVACVNVLGTSTSIFRWEGSVTREREVVAIAKTTRAGVGDAIAAYVEAHPYELPCAVAYPAEGGLDPYLAWVGREADGG